MSAPEHKKERTPRNAGGDRKDRGRGDRGDRPKGKNPLAKDPVQKELNAIKARNEVISQTFTTKLAAIRELENTQHGKDMKAAREKLKEDIYPRLDVIKEEENKIRAVLDKEKEAKRALFEEMKDVLPIRQGKDQTFEEYIKKNYDAIDREVDGLKQELLQVRSLNQEKQVVAAIERTKSQRKRIAEFENQRVASSNYGDRLKELKAQRTAIGEEIAEQKKIIGSNQSVHDENYKKILAIRKELDALKAEREGLNKEYDAKHKILQEKFASWRKEQDELYKQREAEHKARKAKEALERAEEDKQRKLEEAEKPPKMAELKMCDDLITYVKSLRYNKKKPNSKLNHALESFGQFSTFGMTPPKTGKQVPETLAQIEAKKAEIVAFQAVAMEKRAAEAAKKAEEEANKAEAAAEEVPAAEEAAPAEEEAAPAEEAAPVEEAAEETAPAEEAAPAEEEAAPAEEEAAAEAEEAPATEEAAAEDN